MNANNQYSTGAGGKRFIDPKIREWRRFVDEEIAARGLKWKPSGIVAAIMIFESSIWVTKKHTIRKADADNRVKATFDAVALAVEEDDASTWEFHVYKLFSRRADRTHVWLFDLGDVVDGVREVDALPSPA